MGEVLIPAKSLLGAELYLFQTSEVSDLQKPEQTCADKVSRRKGVKVLGLKGTLRGKYQGFLLFAFFP